MGLYKVEIDKPDGSTLVVDCGGNLEQAKAIAINYNKYGYDVYIKETKTVFIRKSITLHE